MVTGVHATGEDIDAVTIWLRGLIYSVIPNQGQAETVFRKVPALVGLIMFKHAVDVSASMEN